MKRSAFFLLTAMALSIGVSAKRPSLSQYDYFNGAAFWQNLVQEDNSGPLLLDRKDTVIIVASSRGYQPDSLRFMTERTGHKSLRFFLIYSRGRQWHVRNVASFSEAKSFLPPADKDWVVYTEGMGKIFTSDVDRGMRMAGQYGVQVLLLDYPSIRTDIGSFKNYYFARSNAVAAYRDFLPLLDSVRLLKLAGKMGSGKLSLFFHSMGNKVIRELILNHELSRLNQQVWVDNVILNAPCVSQKGHRRWIDQIAFARHIYVHYNPEDQTLK